MIQCTMYVDGGVHEEIPLEQISEVIPKRENQVWLDLAGEPPERMRLLKEEFGFHDLALEDCVKAGQRPKVDEYPGYYFLVFYSPYWDTQTNRLKARELHCFVGINYVVTIHKEPIPALATARRRWAQNIAMMREGVGFLVYTIMDSIVDEYFPLLDQIDDLIEAQEDRVFHEAPNKILDDIFTLKKDLLYLRKLLAPKRDIFNIISRRDQPLFPPQTQLYLRDVHDHLIRVLEQVDIQREMTVGLLDAYLSTVTNRTNAVMTTLTVVATVLMALGFIAGIYGMNFKHMPELDWPYGYHAAIGLMALVGGVMTWHFRRKGWF